MLHTNEGIFCVELLHRSNKTDLFESCEKPMFPCRFSQTSSFCGFLDFYISDLCLSPASVWFLEKTTDVALKSVQVVYHRHLGSRYSLGLINFTIDGLFGA